MNIEEVLDQAYELYMPQVRSEITELTKFVSRDYYSVYPYNILEIGTKFGGTFHIWCSLNKTGLNISIDMDDGGKHGGINSDIMDKRDKSFHGKFKNCRFVRGDSHTDETMANLMKVLYPDPKSLNILPEINFLFIDGDHTYEGVKLDFEMYSPLVRKGGLIAFHDILDTGYHRSRDVHVEKFWSEIKHDYKYIEFIDGNEDWGGIGLIIK